MVARLNPDGSPDAAFGDRGILAAAAPTPYAASLAVDAHGRILIATASAAPGAAQVTVARLTPAGQPDPSFGTAGIASPPAGTPADVGDPAPMLIAPDTGDILVPTSYFNVLALARFTA